jgi:hypothetical protein
MWLTLLLLTAIHVYSVQPGYRTIGVRTCSGKWAAIYSDKRMTTPIPNPMLSNADGSYEFYSHETCLDVKEWRQESK